MEKLKAIICALIGHSRIINCCIGYVNCARCNDQMGDTLVGYFDVANCVIIGHVCDTCMDNWKKMTWKDKLMVKYRLK